MADLLKLDLDRPPLVRGQPEYRLEVGGVLNRAFQATLANLPSFLLIGLLLTGPGVLLDLVLTHQGFTKFPFPLGVHAVKGVLGLVLTGALTFAVIRHLRGRRASVEEILRAGWSSVGRVFLVSLFVTLAAFLGFLLCVVPCFLVLCMNWVAVPVAVVEQGGYRASLDRSQELTTGTRWPVLAIILVLLAIEWAVAAATGLALVALSTRFASQLSVEAVPWLVTIPMALVQLPLECLQSAAAAVGYHDLRVHREGADVEDLVRVFE